MKLNAGNSLSVPAHTCMVLYGWGMLYYTAENYEVLITEVHLISSNTWSF